MIAVSLASVLALNRTVGIVLISVLFFGLGEQLWSPFLPAYLDAKTSSGGAQAMAGVSLAALLASGCTPACAICSRLPATSAVGSSPRASVIAAR